MTTAPTYRFTLPLVTGRSLVAAVTPIGSGGSSAIAAAVYQASAGSPALAAAIAEAFPLTPCAGPGCLRPIAHDDGCIVEVVS